MRLLITDAEQFKVKQDLMWVGVLTLVTAIVWIVYSIYLAYNTSTIDPEVSTLLDPLNPTLDQETLSLVADRFEPPQEFTILVIQDSESGGNVVPLGQSQITDVASSSASTRILNSTSASAASSSADF